MQILIVEREVVAARAVADALQSRGHEVAVVASAQEALKKERPEVLIAAEELAGPSGLDLLEEYRRVGHEPHTIFVSASPSLESCQRALRLGAKEFLAKPFRLEDLLRAVEVEPAPALGLFERTYPARPHTLRACLRDVAAFAMQRGVGPSCRARCCTALGEVIENVIDHAYPFEQGELRITATVDERELVVTVTDWGVGCDADQTIRECLMDGGGLTRATALSEDLDLAGGLGLGTTVSMSFDARVVDLAGPERADLTELDFLEPDTSSEVLRTLGAAEGSDFLQLPPSLAVVVGRLLAGPDPRRLVAQALRS